MSISVTLLFLRVDSEADQGLGYMSPIICKNKAPYRRKQVGCSLTNSTAMVSTDIPLALSLFIKV